MVGYHSAYNAQELGGRWGRQGRGRALVEGQGRPGGGGDDSPGLSIV